MRDSPAIRLICTDLAPGRPDRLVFDFHRADDLIAHGARAAERAIEAIQEAIGILAPAALTEHRAVDTADNRDGLSESARLGGLDVIAQRFLLGLVFPGPAI